MVSAATLVLIVVLAFAIYAFPPAGGSPLLKMLGITPVRSPTRPATQQPPSETSQPIATAAPRTLTVCLGAEPETLFVYGGSMLAQNSILEGIYDGPIDPLGYGFEPVILEKLPNLADGDARLEPVTVQAGDPVVNQAGEVVALEAGQVVRPYGCNLPECAIAYEGGAMEMAQLSADFTLKAGLRWSDGEALTASDSVFSYRVAQGCQIDSGPCGGFGLRAHPGQFLAFERTARYTALDERTTRWTGLPGYLDPYYMANYFSPLPEHHLGAISIEALDDAEEAKREPLGWGPYRIEEWRSGEFIRLGKNPDYFRADEGLPRFDWLVFRFVGEDSQQNIADLLSGDCDLVERDAQLDDSVQQLLERDSEGQIQAHVITGGTWEHADFSIGRLDYDNGYQPGADRPDFFGDVRVRQAIAYCLDRQQLIDRLLFGLSPVPDTYLPPEHPLFNAAAAHYPFDVDAAARLLERAGWIDNDGDASTPRIAQGVAQVPDGTPLAFTYATTDTAIRQQGAQILAESLAQCGIQVEVQHLEHDTFFAEPPEGELFSRRFDMAEFAWEAGTLPSCRLYISAEIPGDPNAREPDGSRRFPQGWSGQNITGYSNPEFDLACQAALEALPGQPGYATNHLLAQEIFARDLPAIPLYQRLMVTAARADLCGYRMDPTANSDTWGIEGYGLGEECAP